MNQRWKTILAIDFDRWASATYRANFPDVRVECGPVSDFIDHLPGADALLGGPPCQPHSHAGKRKASADSRDCGPDFVAAVAKVKPRMFLMENVPGLLTSEGGAYFDRLRAALESPGYVVQHRVQDSVDFGVPQFRSRLWVWGIRRDLYVNGVRHCWPMPTHQWPPPNGQQSMFGTPPLAGVTVRQALNLPGGGAGHDGCCLRIIGGGRNHPADSNGNYRRDARDITDEPSTTIVGTFLDGQLPKMVEYRWSDAYRAKHPPIDPDLPCQTVVGQWHKGAPNGVLAVDAPSHTICAGSREPIQHWKAKGYVRRLTADECLRLQSGPDSFVWADGISKTNRYKVIGNGWACGHAAHFSRALAAADPDARTVIDLFCGGGLGACGWHQRFWSYTAEAEVAA